MLARWPGLLEVRGNNTFTISVALGELGGDESVQALTAALAAETNPEWQAHFEFCLQRARRARGPEWNLKLPDPYWKNWPFLPAIDRHQPLF